MAPPDLSFLLRHPAHFIALGFGTGLAPVAPGTVGSLVALPIAWALHAYAGTPGWLVAMIMVAAVGMWATHVTGRHLGVADHASIVVDEIAAFLPVLFFVGDSLLEGPDTLGRRGQAQRFRARSP